MTVYVPKENYLKTAHFILCISRRFPPYFQHFSGALSFFSDAERILKEPSLIRTVPVKRVHTAVIMILS